MKLYLNKKEIPMAKLCDHITSYQYEAMKREYNMGIRKFTWRVKAGYLALKV